MLQKLSFRSGINTDTTDYSNSPGWFDCDHVRFSNGLPEKMRGWEKTYTAQTALDGICRKLFAWTSLSGINYLAAPTGDRFYVSDSGSFTDKSPVRRTLTLGTNPVNTTISSALVTITDTRHGAFAGDRVTFAGLTATGGVPVGDLNKEHVITTILSENDYTVTVATTATSTAAGGGAGGTASYLYQTGTGESTYSAGFGSGFYGGSSAPISSHVLTVAGITTTLASNVTIGSIGYTTITVQLPANHLAVIGDWATIEGATAVDTVPAVYLNRPVEILTVPTASSFTAQIVGTATAASTTAGGLPAVKIYAAIGAIGWGEGADVAIEGFPGLWTVDNYGEDIVACARGLQSSVTLAANPFATTNTSTTVTVTHTAHGLTTGNAVIYSGATATNGISALNMNGSHVITVVNANSYTFVAATAATSTASGGGNMVESYRCSIFYWDVDTAKLVPLTDLGSDYVKLNIPYAATEVLTSDINRHVIAFGTTPFDATLELDKMIIRFSDADDPTDWNAASTSNTSGELRCSSGSYIVTATQTREEIIIWTDTSLYAMTYVGAPYTYGLNLVGASYGIAGPNAKVAVGATVYWMGFNGFYRYNGAIEPIPCSVTDYVFNDINRDRLQQIYCGSNIGSGEVFWFYPSADAVENDRYVAFNYESGEWYYGRAMGARTAWIDGDVFQYPRAMGADSILYTHEIGWDNGSTTPATAITAYVESSPIEIDNGDRMMFVHRIIPDLNFLDTSLMISPEPAVVLTLRTRNLPGSSTGAGDASTISRTTGATIRVNRFTEQTFTRLRARSVILRVESSDAGLGWRLGTPRIDARPDGRK